MDDDFEAKLNNVGTPSDVITELKGLMEACEKKLGINPETIMTAYEKKLKTVPAGMDEEVAARKSFMVIKELYNKQLNSPAIAVDMVVLGCSDNFDINMKIRRTAEEVYAADHDKAITGRLTNADGVPLDTRETLGNRPNPDFGQPLKVQFLRNVFGYYRKLGDKDFGLFTMTLGHNFHKLNVPVGVFCTTRINVARKQDNPNVTALNPSAHTIFTTKDFPDGMSVEGLLMDEEETPVKAIESMAIPLGNFVQWHEKNKTNVRRLMITLADVTWISQSPNDNGSLLIELKDSTLQEDVDHINGFVPQHLLNADGRLGFGAGSRAVIIGNSSARNMEDDEGKSWTQYNTNITGIHPLAACKFAEDEVPAGIVTEQVD